MVSASKLNNLIKNGQKQPPIQNNREDSAVKPVLAIASHEGNPHNPKTWSGTSSNIAKALEDLGINVLGINAHLNRYQKRACMLIHQMSGLGSDFWGGPVFRGESGKIIQRQVKALGCKKVLHMGQLSLPMPKINPGVEHYLVCDRTRNLWNKRSNLEGYTPKMLKIAERLEWESFAQIKHFFPLSEYVRDNLIDYYQIDPSRITVINTGRGSLQPFYGEKDYKNGHILFVAKDRFEAKGGPLLLEGFKIAQQKNPSLKLVIVGQENYKHLNGVIPNLTVHGFIPWGEELQNLFNTAALFAMPAINEAWGLVYLEALATKNPILALNRTSLPEITQNGKYGFLMDEQTPERMAELLLEAFSDSERLQKMGAAGQKHCLQSYSWQQTASKIASVMLDIPASKLKAKEFSLV